MRLPTIVAASAALALAVSACGSSSKSAEPGVKTVEISLTDAGCDPAHLEVPAGPTRFEITNDGADAVTEFEVLSAGKVLGERENLTPGLSGDFSITLKPGTYVTLCPGGKTDPKGELIVTGGASTKTTGRAQSAAAQRAGNLAEAKRFFPATRTHYESIEPIAESFGDLDPEIDARANDVIGA